MNRECRPGRGQGTQTHPRTKRVLSRNGTLPSGKALVAYVGRIAYDGIELCAWWHLKEVSDVYTNVNALIPKTLPGRRCRCAVKLIALYLSADVCTRSTQPTET